MRQPPPPPEHEPTFRTSLGRLLREAVHVVFFVGLHWLTTWSIHQTRQEKTWWAPILENGTAIFAVAGILGLGGIELLVDLILAVKTGLRRIGIGRLGKWRL
jgi:hypothetical protein